MRVSFSVAIAMASFTAVTGVARAVPIYAILNNDPSVGQSLVSFDSGTRAVTSTVVLQTANTLSPLSSIDVQPSTGQLYGIGALNDQLYTINPSSGALTLIGSPLPASGNIDFNPVTGTIRLINPANNANYSIDPNTGAVLSTDTPLAYGSGDTHAGSTPVIHGIAYSNSTPGASTTTLYDLDVANEVLDIQNPVSAGTLSTVGSFGVSLDTGAFGTFTGFDIGAAGTAYVTDGAFAGASNFYTLNLATGALTSQGVITGLPAGRTIAEIAVASSVPEPASLGLIALAGVACLSRRRNRLLPAH